MKAEKPLVAIVMGSDSDLPVMEEAGKVLSDFEVPFEMTITSAHRSPDRAAKYAREAEERGIEVLIAGAGGAAHLGGGYGEPTQSCRSSGCPWNPGSSASIPCFQPCRCPEAYPLPRWRLAGREPETRPSWRFRSSPESEWS